MTINQLIDNIIDEVNFNKPGGYENKSVADIVENNPGIVNDVIRHEVDEDTAIMLFEYYCANKFETLNGYVPTTHENVDILTALYYDVCDTARKYCADDE